ncbi:family 43 glycosylhydrolase [Bifidobacterium sp. ESL0704]|uniref:family 43 glycosylhydrolase n=1 Tax=Bifidobacterium sp. ESL0704 TaxID=2983219 RepID=UPI0023F650E2|nr:family 43 glycosylhydrolase [Bifidobacterium sp. ESL0704]WEV53086.1 family 43 glycosylhydrolase [Bifidobacterium sp. ESL0704]
MVTRMSERAGRCCALLAAASMLVGMVGVTSANAGPVKSVTRDGRSTVETRSDPQKIVDYNFSDAANGASSVNNAVSGSALGAATITKDGAAPTGGTFNDKSLAMDGNYYVKLPDNILKGHNSATVSTVVKNDQFNSSGAQWTYLWSLGSTGQSGKGSWTASTHTSLYASVTSKGNGDGETFFSAGENLSMDKFQTLTSTIDGSTKTAKLYINGREVGSSKITADISKFADQTNDVIGQSRYPGVGDAFFHGAVRSFTVYDGAMTPRQIAKTLPSEGVDDLLGSEASALKVPQTANADFTLPTSTADASITWSSDNGAIAVNNATGKAKVTLPAQDTTVNLTATLTPAAGMASPSKTVTKSFQVLVPKVLNDAQFRQKVADSVSLGENVDANNVRGDLLLPSTMSISAYDFTGNVTWKSSNTKLVSIADNASKVSAQDMSDASDAGSYEAKVTRPDCGGAQKVELTATVSEATTRMLSTPVTKTFTLAIQPLSAGNDTTHVRVTSHDPSIVKANGKYYIFGSHRAFAKSTDLQHWQYFSNNLVTNYHQVLDPIFNEWSKQDSNPDVTGNMWAPEVIWNKTMHKWCMYLSVNGDNFRSVIVLLTADDIEGDWTYVGPVVYSGFRESTKQLTDVPRVLGEHADLSRYLSPTDTEINAIDASVKYDGNDMWMAFGSWFGGIWMLKLDPATGLRDYNTTYQTKANVSDAYYGHKLAGGYGNSGEGTALAKADGYWHLMLSYGGLTQTGGYQMREFRSKSITGPYLDQNGNAAVYTQKVSDDKAFNRGLRILSSYDQPGSENVKTSQGGNAIVTDSDGSVYNVYHTRFVRTEGNLEEHQVRVQPMVSSDGWLVMAPFEKSGEVTSDASYTASALAGTYNFVVHNPVSFYAGGGLTSQAIYHAVPVTLNADGSLSGTGIAGTWQVKGRKVTLNVTSAPEATKLHGSYSATVGYQTDETGHDVVFFSGLGGDVFTDNGPDATVRGGKAAFWGVRQLPQGRGIATAEVPCSTNPGDGTQPIDNTVTPNDKQPGDKNQGNKQQQKNNVKADGAKKLVKTGAVVGSLPLFTVVVALAAAMLSVLAASRRKN